MRLCLSALLAALVLAAVPSAALAADVCSVGATITFTAADGEANALTVSVGGTRRGGAVSLRLGHRRLARGRYDLVLTFAFRGHRIKLEQRVRVA